MLRMRRRGALAFWALLVCLVPAFGVGPGWRDPDTPYDVRRTTSLHDGRMLGLVMSDEFNTAGRTFGDGHDDRWTALEKNDYTNDALHYYSEENAMTERGHLAIETRPEVKVITGFDDVKREPSREVKNYTSAMLQTWNKFCFTGGAVEARIRLPGSAHVGGLWPAFWMLGNLARHTYVGSSNWIWPWSKTRCQPGLMSQQRINGCLSTGHYGMKPHVGRGAPEVDILEAQPGPMKAGTGDYENTYVGEPFVSTSLQVAPGRSSQRPGPGNWPGPQEWYNGIKFGKNSSININFYGTYNHFEKEFAAPRYAYWSDAVSWNTQLTEKHFNSFHTYRLEWGLPDEHDPTEGGYLSWFIDDELVLLINSTNLNTGHTGSEIPSEPAYILLNVAISKNWGFPKDKPGNTCPKKCFDCAPNTDWTCSCGLPVGFCEQMPTRMLVDYVRVWQDPEDDRQKVGCSTPERPTKAYINGHAEVYKKPEDKTPLKPTMHGGAACNPEAKHSDACSAQDQHGECVAAWYNSLFGARAGKCACSEGWTGPHCRSSTAGDEVVWDPDVTTVDLGFQPPIWQNFLVYFITLLVALVGAILGYQQRLEKFRR